MATGTLSNAKGFQDPTSEHLRGKYIGLERGFVRDRNDPKKMGRIRCFVPSVNDTDSSTHWIWCEPASAGLAVPPLKQPVWLAFEQGIVTHAVYIWGWGKGDYGAKSNFPGPGVGLEDPTRVEAASVEAGGSGIDFGASAPADEASSQYPYNKIFVSESGHVLELDDTPEKPRARYRHPTGTTILIDPDGSVRIQTKGAQHFESEGDINFMLKNGATFKVAYPGGAGIAVGASGVVVKGAQVNIMGRPVVLSPDPIK